MRKNKPDVFEQHQTRLKAGDTAPYFEAKDQDGKTVCLTDFSGKRLVLYFYPKDDTPTCTNQACSLRDGMEELVAKGYHVLGVSADDEKSHTRFIKKFNLPFPLLSDPNMRLIRAYDVWGTKMLFGKIMDGIVRTTFIINGKGIIERVITDVVSKHHAQQILEPQK